MDARALCAGSAAQPQPLVGPGPPAVLPVAFCCPAARAAAVHPLQRSPDPQGGLQLRALSHHLLLLVEVAAQS